MSDETVPCGTCGTPTRMTGTKRCNLCWQVESNLAQYAQSERGRLTLRWYGLEPGDLESAVTPKES